MHSNLHGHPALAHAIKKLERLNPDQFEIYFERRIPTCKTSNFAALVAAHSVADYKKSKLWMRCYKILVLHPFAADVGLKSDFKLHAMPPEA